jgi:hypothetical protein
MNDKWIAIEQKLPYLCLHGGNVDYLLLSDNLKTNIIRLMANKLSLTENSDIDNIKSIIDKDIMLLYSKYAKEDEKELLLDLRRFVYKEL